MVIAIRFEGSANKVGVGIVRDGEVLSSAHYRLCPGRQEEPNITASVLTLLFFIYDF